MVGDGSRALKEHRKDVLEIREGTSGGKGLSYPNEKGKEMNRKPHWTHQQGIAHKLSTKYDDKRATHWVVFQGKSPGVYSNYAQATEKAGDAGKSIRGYPSEAKAIEAFTKHFLKKAAK